MLCSSARESGLLLRANSVDAGMNERERWIWSINRGDCTEEKLGSINRISANTNDPEIPVEVTQTEFLGYLDRNPDSSIFDQTFGPVVDDG